MVGRVAGEMLWRAMWLGRVHTTPAAHTLRGRKCYHGPSDALDTPAEEEKEKTADEEETEVTIHFYPWA